MIAVVSSALLPFGRPYRSVANPLAVPVLAGPLQVAAGVTLVVTGLAILVAAWSLVVRFRRARGVERQQLRWVAAALTTVVVLALVALVAVAATDNQAPLDWLLRVCVALLSVAIGAAVLRYRLYGLDRIISRTLAYGLLTVLLGGGYTGVVLGFGQLLGRNSSLVVAGATLAVAAVFQPARRRIQAAVDRRFNRHRYDAARTIQAFSARLREEVDLDTLTGELLAIVHQHRQPQLLPAGPRQPGRAAAARRPGPRGPRPAVPRRGGSGCPGGRTGVPPGCPPVEDRSRAVVPHPGPR
jgi:hypothetical protein